MATSLHLSHFRRWFSQSPPVVWGIQQLRELLLGALRQGPVPEHIAFVMDGNRRFARSHQIETIEGHNLGFESLARILEVCYKTGVRVVTIYAFSIENFKRSKYEVTALMDMAKVKLSQLAQHGELLERYGAKLQFLGQKEMVRPDVLEAIEKAISMTSSNGRAVLNICAPYTSRDEITTAVRDTVDAYSHPLALPHKRPFSETHIRRHIKAQQQLSTVGEEDNNSAPSKSRITSLHPPSSQPQHRSRTPSPSSSFQSQDSERTASTDEEDIAPPSSSSTTLNLSTTAPEPSVEPQTNNYPDPESITAATLDAYTFTAGCPPLDLLIRTSGVERLSDFMLWQCHETTDIVFLKCLWPEFDLWHFLPVLLEWQWRRRKGVDGGKSSWKVRKED